MKKVYDIEKKRRRVGTKEIGRKKAVGQSPTSAAC
jgi:hypothetical protein